MKQSDCNMQSDGSPAAGDETSIQAIETVYNGYRFRSRLEARWAVFFDALRVRYEYEPEGFELSCGKYLPDFYLDEFDVYIEIKPFRKDIVHHVGDDNEWEQKCRTFRDETGKAILVCYADPSASLWMRFFAWDATDAGVEKFDGSAAFKCSDGRPYIVVTEIRDMCMRVNGGDDVNERVITPIDWVRMHVEDYAQAPFEDFDPDGTDNLNMAKLAARQARFEHGETPDVANVGGGSDER